MALQETTDNARAGQHHCRDCGVFFESGKSLEVHLQYHKENLLSKWANQAAAAAHAAGDSENNNVKRREFQTAPADSTVLPTGPGRPNSTSGYPGSSSPFPHPQTPQSYTSAPSPYQSDAPSNPGPSPSSTSYGYSNGGDQYNPVPYNGYSRSPRSHPGYYPDQPQQQEHYAMAPATENTPHSPSSSSGFRFFNKNCYPHDKNGVTSSSPNTCDKCGCVCESPAALQEHMKSHPPYPHGHGSAFQAPEFFKQEATHDSPDILDLDCQQKFRPPEEESASLPPVGNPHSVSAMLNPWPHGKFPPYHVSSSNPQQPPPPFQNGSSYPPESFSPPNVPNNPPIPNATSPKPASGAGGKGDSWKSNEARRPKTYNCSACNKWFTSSGHLKRHYNTTLHKNAVKQSGGPDPATLPISSHHHPNRDPNYIHSSKTPPGVPNPPPNMNLSSMPKAKKAKSMSPQGDGEASSPALSTTNEGDSSRSGFGNYDMPQPQPQPPQPPFDNGYAPAAPAPEHFDYYRYENRLQPQQNSTNQIASQPPNYQAGPSVSPSGGLPTYPPSLPSLPTPNLLIFMGENIMMPVENGQQLQALDPPTITHCISSPTTTGSVGEVLPSFSQLMPENQFRDMYMVDSGANNFIKEEVDMDEDGYGDDVDSKDLVDMDTFQDEVADQQCFEFADVDPMKDSKVPCYQMMQPVKIHYQPPPMSNYSEFIKTEETPPSSPLQVPTSTNVELESPSTSRKFKGKKKKRKLEVSSNQVSSTGSPKPLIRCEECDKTFNRICYLTQHNKCFHSGEKPFRCEKCGKRFHTQAKANDHERKHNGVKPYRCDVCPKSFHHKTDLRRHLCLHSGNKPYTCTSCGKGFIRKDHMLKHLDTHSNNKRRLIEVEQPRTGDKAEEVQYMIQAQLN